MRKVVVALGILPIMLAPAPASGCSFVERSAEATFARADVVFVGSVSSIEHPRGRRTVRALIDVSDVYKGQVPPKVVVVTAASDEACGVAFVPGERYAVFGTLVRGAVRTDASRVSLGDERLAASAHEPIARYPAGSPAADPGSTRTSRAGLIAAALLLIGLAATGHLVRRRIDWRVRHAI